MPISSRPQSRPPTVTAPEEDGLEGCKVAVSAHVHRAIKNLVGLEVKVGLWNRECQRGWELEWAPEFHWQILTPWSHCTQVEGRLSPCPFWHHFSRSLIHPSSIYSFSCSLITTLPTIYFPYFPCLSLCPPLDCNLHEDRDFCLLLTSEFPKTVPVTW